MRCSLSEWITCMSFLELPKRARALSLLSLTLSAEQENQSRVFTCASFLCMVVVYCRRSSACCYIPLGFR